MRHIESSRQIPNNPDSALIALLQELIRIPSWVSPEKRLKTIHNENQLIDFLENWLKLNTNLDIDRQQLAGGRFNLIATKGKPDLIFLAHTDTVEPSANPPYDQFAAEIHGRKIWGLGSTDMKSGIATMAQALSLSPDAQNLWMFFYADEEKDFLGMKALVERYGDLRPKFIVSSDGSDFKLGHGCRGLIEIRARIRGVTGHAAKGNGISAIDQVYRCLEKTKGYVRKYKHPVMGNTSINLAFILGGQEKTRQQTYDKNGFLKKVGQEGNVIPDIAEFVVDVRPSSPDLTVGKLIDQLRNTAEAGGCKFELVNLRHNLGAWFTEIENAQTAAQIVKEITGHEAEIDKPGESGYLDLQMLWEATGRPPAFMLGGGKGNTAHTPHEHIEIEDLIKERDFFKKVVDVYAK